MLAMVLTAWIHVQTVFLQHCKACHRDRYPPWLKDLHGNLVHPGLIITPDG